MKKLLFVLSAIMLCGCSNDNDINYDDENVVTKISLSTSEMVVGSETGSCSISVRLTTEGNSYNEPEWVLSGGASWCTPSKTSGQGDYVAESTVVIEFTLSENPDSDDRSTTFTITCQNLQSNFTIIQKGKDTLTVTASKIEIESDGGDVIIEVNANVDYTYEIADDCKEWITTAGTRALETTQIKLNVAPNPELKERQGAVTVSSGNISEKVTIIQSAAEPYIEVVQSEYEVSKDGETIEIEVHSNCTFNITIPDYDWVKEVKNNTASANVKYFEISKNTQPESRKAEIIFAGKEYDVSAKVSVTQQSASSLEISVNVQQVGTLESVLSQYKLDEADVVSLKISGVLNDVDFLYIRQIKNLKNLDISEVNIAILPNRAFYESENVESIALPNTLTEIGVDMFYGSNLKSVIIPKEVTRILDRAFKHCEQLQDVSFAKDSKLSYIGGGHPSTNYGTTGNVYGAFAGCINLATIEIPASVETIEASAFKGCISLKDISFEANSQLKTIGGGFQWQDYTNTRYMEYYGAFYGCTALTAINIPANVETIECTAFIGCSNLNTVSFEKGSQLKTIGGKVFYSADTNSDVSLGAFSGCPITHITIPASVETIEYAAFKGCKYLTTLLFEKNSQLKTIGGIYSYGAFANCVNLVSIEIPKSVEQINDGAFQNCSRLQSVSFENGSNLKIIGGERSGNDNYGAFAKCTSLADIKIPASVEVIETNAFYGCSNLTTVTFEKGSQLKTIEGGVAAGRNHGAFYALENLKVVDMSECKHVSSFGENAFRGNKNLQLVKIGTEIPPSGYAFKGIGSYAILKVPSDCVDAYKKSDYYRDFANITGLDE